MVEVIRTVLLACVISVVPKDVHVVGEYIDSKFQLYGFCEGVNYGSILSNQSNIVSLVECGSLCSLESTCLSFVFNDVTGICVTNAHAFDTTSLTGCSLSLTYGAKLVCF